MNRFFACAVAGAVLLAAPAPAGYEWRTFADDADQLALWRDGAQLGNYRVSEARYYPLLGPGRWGEPCAPPYPPPPGALPGRREADGTMNYGLVIDRLQPAGGKHLLNGREVTRAEVFGALGELRDDRRQLYLTVIGDDASRAAVRRDLEASAELAPWKGRLKVHDYAPDHWAVSGGGFRAGGRPTVYVQAPDGKVLHRQDDYRGPHALAEALRKADPRYRPERDPDLNRTLPQLPPWLWVGGAVLVILLLGKGGDK